MPSLLNSDWTVTQPLPGEYRERIEAALPLAIAATAPATVEQFGVAMADLVEWIETYGVMVLPDDRQQRREKLSQIVGRYRKDLAELPADLLADGIRHVTGSGEFRTLPLPGDIRKVVADELARRRFILLRLKSASRFGKFIERARPDQRVGADRFAEMRRILAGAGPQLRTEEASTEEAAAARAKRDAVSASHETE